MIRSLIVIIFAAFPGMVQNTPLYVSKSVSIKIFSEAPIENIEAYTKTGYGVINTSTGDIQFGVVIKSFDFAKKMMQEHFNENYMESNLYPVAKFKGRFNPSPDMSKNGEYEITVSGELEVHGVKQQRTIKGLLKVTEGKIEVNSVFDVKCVEHRINIPAIVFKNIAETIRVTVSGSFISTSNQS